MFVDLMGTEKTTIVVHDFVTSFAEDTIDILDYLAANQEEIQNNI
jgi:hypothetical protein